MRDTSHAIRVFLVDDHPLVRESLTGLIDRQSDMVVCGEAEDSSQALRTIGLVEPDVAVMDISLKEASGLELLKAVKLRLPAVKLIVLSMHDEKLYAERCIRAGANGYVMKAESTKRIISAIRDVMTGHLCVSEEMAASFAEKYIDSRPPLGKSPLEDLSDRELEVFNLLGRGLETRQVAQSLNVSIKTVQAYCARMKQKLKLTTAAELVREAIRWHERQPPSDL
jgi:DNA-binding NarL/FixJ family response regulator